MAMNVPISLGALVVDANIAIALYAREAAKFAKTQATITSYSAQGWTFYAPGVLVSETLFILCGKLQNGTLTSAEHAVAVQEFGAFMTSVYPAPHGEASLVAPAERIRGSYGCSRSADGIYLALLEQLVQTGPAKLLTFDAGLERQAAQNGLGPYIHLLVA